MKNKKNEKNEKSEIFFSHLKSVPGVSKGWENVD